VDLFLFMPNNFYIQNINYNIEKTNQISYYDNKVSFWRRSLINDENYENWYSISVVFYAKDFSGKLLFSGGGK